MNTISRLLGVMLLVGLIGGCAVDVLELEDTVDVERQPLDIYRVVTTRQILVGDPNGEIQEENNILEMHEEYTDDGETMIIETYMDKDVECQKVTIVHDDGSVEEVEDSCEAH